MHDRLMRHVAIGEDDLVDVPGTAEPVEFRFIDNRDAVGIQSTSELGRISPPRNSGYLGRGKGDNLAHWVIAIDHVEVVEIATRSAEDDEPPAVSGRSRWIQLQSRCNRF